MIQKRLGWMILFMSLVVLVLLMILYQQIEDQRADACRASCGDASGELCTMANCPYTQQSVFPWILWVAGILIASLGGVGAYLALTKSERIIQEKTYDLSKLSKNEKDVFLFVKENKEGVYQSKIGSHFDLSKVKVTRILDTLEQHGLIERKRRGMTNLVTVK